METFDVWHEALTWLLWTDAKDHKMPGVHIHKIESEISRDKGQKWQGQISSPGKFPSALLVSPPLTQHAYEWEEISLRGLRSYCNLGS